MTSPGKHLIDLATFLEEHLESCGRDIGCVDLSFNSAIVPPVFAQGGCTTRVDVGFNQNPFRALETKTLGPQYRRSNSCTDKWRMDGLVRVSGAYDLDPNDCCHEHTEFMYEFTNTILLTAQGVQNWLATTSSGETTQTQFVMAYNGGWVTVGIAFTLIVCTPSCEDLLAEEAEVKGLLDGLKN